MLVHGYPLDSRGWFWQVPPLLAAGHRVITYDRRGFGRSSHHGECYDYDVLAADLDALLTELDLTDAGLVGHASGTGDITRYLATYGSARVSRSAYLSGLGPFLLRTAENLLAHNAERVTKSTTTPSRRSDLDRMWFRPPASRRDTEATVTTEASGHVQHYRGLLLPRSLRSRALPSTRTAPAARPKRQAAGFVALLLLSPGPARITAPFQQRPRSWSPCRLFGSRRTRR
ncbi:alpha/beta fold hydrolase [Streptomyces sp. NPDC001275]